QSRRVGIYAHYSETHDNMRLAERGRGWSLMRNQLSALSSVSGTYGFTCGVEWLATEKIEVHQSRGLAWGNPENLVLELSRLNKILADHPCFLDGAILARITPEDSPVYGLTRVSADGLDRVLALVNTDVEKPQPFRLSESLFRELGKPSFDLLSSKPFTRDLLS